MITSVPPIISIRRLKKSYGRVTVLEGIDLAISAGGLTAVLGPNGAGKTTLIHCALGLVRPDAGSIQVLGGKAGSMAVRGRTGVMLQDADLPDLLTPREHLALFSSYYANPRPPSEILDLCGLTEFADKRYGRLSGGQKRRTQFALAIAGWPDVVFLDEPTTGLDTGARRRVWSIIRTFIEAGKSIILTTHYLEEADALADRIVILGQGRIIANAPTPEIRSRTANTVIQCETAISLDGLSKMSAVKTVRPSGRLMEILSEDATATLKDLLAADPQLHDLSVRKAALEDVFLDLTAPVQTQGD